MPASRRSLRGRGVVAGQHHHVDAHALQRRRPPGCGRRRSGRRRRGSRAPVRPAPRRSRVLPCRCSGRSAGSISVPASRDESGRAEHGRLVPAPSAPPRPCRDPPKILHRDGAMPWLPRGPAPRAPADARSPARGSPAMRRSRPQSHPRRHTSVSAGLPSVSVPVLSTTSMRMRARVLERIRVLTRMPRARRARCRP